MDEHMMRQLRNQRLKESDWTQVGDVPQEIKDMWVVYRQELRDITDDPEWPNVQLPLPPDAR